MKKHGARAPVPGWYLAAKLVKRRYQYAKSRKRHGRVAESKSHPMKSGARLNLSLVVISRSDVTGSNASRLVRVAILAANRYGLALACIKAALDAGSF